LAVNVKFKGTMVMVLNTTLYYIYIVAVSLLMTDYPSILYNNNNITISPFYGFN